MNDLDPLDQPIWGAREIGRVARITNKRGDVDVQQVYYAVKKMSRGPAHS